MITTFRYRVPVRHTMDFEKLYHPNLAFGYREKLHLLRTQTVAVWMFVNGELAGESYGMKPEDSGEQIEGCARYQDGKTIYVYSTSILKKFQGKGLGRVLKAYFNGLVFGRGFKRIVGHSTNEAILALNQSFGAKIISKFENWYGTGQTAYLYEIAGP